MTRNLLQRGILLGATAMIMAVAAHAGDPDGGHRHHDAAVTSEEAASRAQTTCPVRGNPIDEDAYVIHQGQKVYFCCPGCEGDFLADPEAHYAKLAEQGVIVESVQTVCPITGRELPDHDTSIEYAGRRIYFCCPGCDETFLKDPATHLEQVK